MRANARSARGSGLQALLAFSRVIDAINTRLGKWLAWAILAAVIISAGNAIVRKLFDMSSNTWLELQWILFSIVFLLCSPWTLLRNEHIRIDIINNMLPKPVRNWIDLLGHLFFLLPFTVVMIITGWPFFIASIRINEQSSNAGGLPQWPAKFLVPLCFFLLFFQGISELIKRIAVMRGMIDDPNESAHDPVEAEVEGLIQAIKSADKTAGGKP
jgi:TRAP-type mannitol/chloroaromatic compound transport system permease small subunit